MGSLLLLRAMTHSAAPLLGAGVVRLLRALRHVRLLDVSLEADLEPEVDAEEHQPRRDDEGQAEAGAVRDVEQRQQQVLPGDATRWIRSCDSFGNLSTLHG